MLCRWPSVLILAALPFLVATIGTPKNPGAHRPHEHLQSLLRVEGSSSAKSHSHVDSGKSALPERGEDEVSAVISSKGIRYMSPHRTEHHKNATIVQQKPQEPAGFAKASHRPAAVLDLHGAAAFAEVAGPNVSQVVGSSETAPCRDGSSGTAPCLEKSEKPNVLYFAIGVGTFLIALVSMVFSVRKLNYVQEDSGMLAEGNPQDEPTHDASQDVRHPGELIQHRMQQVLVSWIFITASTAFFVEFLSFAVGLDMVRNWFSVVSSLLWLFGFLIHLHWQFSVGLSHTQLSCTVLKVLACVLGQVHPFCMIMGYEETDPGVWWPAVAGMAFWHVGNVVGTVDNFFSPPSRGNRNVGILAHGNLPVIETWIDQAATWLLLIAAASITFWLGSPEKQLFGTKNGSVFFCEFAGAGLFLFSSCVKCEWCNGFRNCNHQPE